MSDRLPRLDRDRAYLRDVKNPKLGMKSGITVVGGSIKMAGTKAPADGIYTLGGARFRVRKGATVPDGAAFERAKSPATSRRMRMEDRRREEARLLQQVREEERAEGAPENESAGTAPENENTEAGMTEAELMAMTRPELDAKAAELGVDDPGAMGNKSEVVAAILDASPTPNSTWE